MQDKDTTKSTFDQLFKPVCNAFYQLESTEVDKYVKKLTTLQLIELLIKAQLEQLPGLRDISNSLNNGCGVSSRRVHTGIKSAQVAVYPRPTSGLKR
ncbi:DUF4372 domain-containing protein [Desulfocucumis palustris]|uniref:DUF4372 domain-containing protein n=1 Tax=Desulfocucumis palustris TaxID=1898651 RepID=UPI000CE9C683|nr:DUF4372 domain-containing protein [Desulfocucumis palustris]